MGRRDIWLMTDGRRWHVRARQRGEEAPEVNYDYDDEGDARKMVQRLMDAAPVPGPWCDLTEALWKSREFGET
jgi:hypothetical protein